MVTKILRLIRLTALTLCLVGIGAHASYAANTMALPSEGIILPNGVKVLPDGTIIDGGRVITPSNTIVSGTTVYVPQSASSGGSSGATLYADRVVFGDGRQYYWNDNRIIMPDGSNILSDGRVLQPDGTTLLAQRGRLSADGVTLPNGMVIAPGLQKSIVDAKNYGNELPRSYDAAVAAQMAQVLPPREMRNYYDAVPPRDAAAALDAMNLAPDAFAQYAKDTKLSGAELGQIMDHMESFSADEMQSVLSGLSAAGFPKFHMEELMSNMPGFMQGLGPAAAGFLAGLGLDGGGLIDKAGNFLGNLFGTGGGAGNPLDGFGGNNAFAGGSAADTRYETEVFYGNEIPGSKSPVPIPHLTTPLASLIAEYSPHLYVKAIDQEKAPLDYNGEFYRDSKGSPRVTDNMLGFSKSVSECSKNPSAPGCQIGDGRRLNGCVNQLEPPSNYENMSLQEKAAFNRLRLDNCANQYILMAAMFPQQVDAPNEGLVGNDAANACQPLKVLGNHLREYDDRKTVDSAGLIKTGKNYVRDYVEGAWKKLLQDEKFLIRGGAAPREPNYSYGGSNNIQVPLRIKEELDTTGNLRRVSDLYASPSQQVEQIIDPTHPFSPRWDYQTTEREKYSPRAKEGWGADEKNSVYCAGSKNMVDEWDCKSSPYGCKKGADQVHDMAVHIMDFRATEYDQHLNIRMRFNKRCKDDKITEDLKDMIPGCFIDIYYGFGKYRHYFPCWSFMCMGAFGLHPLGSENPPCAVRLGGKDTPALALLRQIVGNTIGNMADVGQLVAVGSLMSAEGLQKELGNATNGAFRNTLSQMNMGGFNMGQLLSNGGVQGLMGQLNPASMLNQFQMDTLFQMPNFQQMVGQLGFGKLQAQFDGVVNSITGLTNVQGLLAKANPAHFIGLADATMKNALQQTLGIDKFQAMMANGMAGIGSLRDMFDNASQFTSFLQNPDVMGVLNEKYQVQDMFTKMSAGAIFNPDDPESMAILGSVIGQDKVSQWQQAGVLKDRLSGTMEQLAGGQQEAIIAMDKAEQALAQRKQERIANECTQSDGAIIDSCAAKISSNGIFSQGIQGMNGFMQTSGVQDILTEQPWNQMFNSSQLGSFFSSDGFQTQIASGMENFGQLVGGSDKLMALAGNADFLAQLQGMKAGAFFQGVDNLNVLGTDLFGKFNGSSLTDLWGDSGFAANLPQLPSIIDPKNLQGMLDQFDASKLIGFDQFKGWMNNGTLQSLVGGEWASKLQGMGGDQLKSFFNNNPLSKVMGGNFMNALTQGGLLEKLPFDKMKNVLGDSSISELSGGLTEGLGPLEDILDFMGCGERSINKICRDLAAPFGMLNKLKLKHFSAEKHAEDPFSVELPLGVPEGLTFQEYFGVHRPYAAYHDTGKEHGQTGGSPDLKKSTLGAEVAIVGVGRPTERCLFGGGGGAMSGAYGPFGGGSYVNVPTIDPITSWAELKLYQARGTRRNLNCITKFNQVWKPNFTEDPILMLDGAQIEVRPIEEENVAQGQTVKQLWFETYRGYCLDPNNDLSGSGVPNTKRNFPYFPSGDVPGASLKYGLERAKPGDIVVFENGTTSSSGPFGIGSKPGLCTLGYVVGVSEASGKTPESVRIIEANWGNYPDVCGITDAVDPHPSPSERTLYKGKLNPVLERRIKQRSGSDGSCSDNNLAECALDENIWNNVKVFDPTLDPRDPD